MSDQGSILGDPRQCWGTPRPLFETLHRELAFTVDACALPFNAKLPKFWTPADDGLAQDWRGQSVWCNPPYSNITPWIEKAYWSTKDPDVRSTAALLLPARVDQLWWHQFAMRASSVSFFCGRIEFVPPPGIKASSAREGFALVVFTQRKYDHAPSLSARDSATGAELRFAAPSQQADIFQASRTQEAA